MKKNLKKGLSLLLAALMIMTSIQVFASEELVAQEGVTATEDVVNETAEENEIVPMSLLPIEEVDAVIDLSDYSVDQLISMTNKELFDNLKEQYSGEPIKIDETATTVWCNFFDETGKYVYDTWKVMSMDSTVNVLSYFMEDYYNVEIIIGSGNQLDPANVRYLVDFKLPEVDAYIDLSDCFCSELYEMPVSELVNRMTIDGEPLEITDANAVEILWDVHRLMRYGYTFESAVDGWVSLKMDDTIKFAPTPEEMWNNAGTYYWENQTMLVKADGETTLYSIDVTYPEYSDIFNFNLYSQTTNKGKTEREAIAIEDYYEYNTRIQTTQNNYNYGVRISGDVHSRYSPDEDYYFGIQLKNKFSDANIKILNGWGYTTEEVENYVESGRFPAGKEVTEQFLVEDMSQTDAGIKAKWLNHCSEGQITLCIIVGNKVFLEPIRFDFYPNTNSVNVDYDMYMDSAQTRIVASDYYSNDWNQKQVNGSWYQTETLTYKLNEGLSASDEYYIGMYFYDGDTREHLYDASRIDKAVVGHYYSLESAKNQPDIKEQLFVENMSEKGAGYKGNFGGNGIDFTVFSGDDVWLFTVKVEENTFAYDDAPVVGSSDRYFGVYDVYDNSEDSYNGLDTYVVPYEHDTYYSYGYQALLINDKDVDMTALKPYVSLGYNAKVYHNGVLEETDDSYNNILSAQDFSKIPEDLTRDPRNSVKYTVSAENHIDQKNYWVTVVKKESGAKLFVNGPDEREIFLNDYFDNVHDIFIANIGDEELTGLKVTLDATNVKLDDYWTVGGEGNDTLAPFTETYASNRNYNGELFNVGKIRLIPDGEGDIKGTLTIEADGQEKRVINLKGKAGNPRIDTDSLHDAVKYVPYQSIITTTNMHDWNKVTFELYSGKLPEGVNLLPSGELYGVPKETGTFEFKVRANYSHSEFTDSIATLTLNVLENTDENVNAQVDKGYEIITRVPDLRTASDQVFELEYDYAEHQDEYQGFYLDGEKLEPDVDYTVEAGSTKITIKSQTINNAGNGTHTIAAEYRNSNNEVKKAAQNYNYGSSPSVSYGGGGGGGTPSYKVWFEVNGGAWLDAVTVKKGDAISSLPTPERNGFAFGGWYKDAELTQPFDSNEKITATTTLYAKWVDLYTIWFIENGGEPVDDMSVQNGQTASVLPTPVKDGFVFDGWYKDEALTQAYDINEPVTASISLYAKWIEDKAPVDASGFRDVSKTDWFYSDVEWAYRNKFMIGVSNVDFAPNDLITGGMVVTVLARLAKVDVSKYENLAYDDIYENEWYTPYAKWAKAEGLVDGIPFNPPEEISRESMAVILIRFLDYVKAEYNVNDEVIHFADEELISEEAMEALQTLFKLSVFKGVGNNNIDPISFTTRAQLAALMHRIDRFLNK